MTKSLDKNQQQAVFSEHSHILCSAGAGSGKTYVLTERVRYMIESRGIDPQSIVVITFTNMSAQELRERLADVPDNDKMFIGTIHSLAYQMLQNASSIQYKVLSTEVLVSLTNSLIVPKLSQFILDLIESNHRCNYQKNYKYIVDKYYNNTEVGYIDRSIRQSFDNPRVMKKIFYSVLSLLPNRLKINDTNCPLDKDMMSKLIQEYIVPQDIISQGYITFDQILKLSSKIDTNNLEGYHILVDEFQDIGPSEYEFIMSLPRQSIFLVGDDWQSIYGFKGSNVEYFMNSAKDPKFEVIKLSNNYRCCKEVVRYGLRVISKMITHKLALPKDVSVVNNKRGKIFDNLTLDEGLDRINESMDYQNWFILTRTNKDLSSVCNILKSRGIPYISFKKSEITYNELHGINSCDKIKVLTIHSAKGLESEKVLLYLPYYTPLTNSKYLGDELKVLYVGVTRAISELLICDQC